MCGKSLRHGWGVMVGYQLPDSLTRRVFHDALQVLVLHLPSSSWTSALWVTRGSGSFPPPTLGVTPQYVPRTHFWNEWLGSVTSLPHLPVPCCHT